MIRNRSLLAIFHLAALLILSVGFAAPASAEWKEKVLYSFQGGTNDGFVPAGGVVFDKQGNLYGATTGGGPASCAPYGNECGTVFQLSPDGNGKWTETIIYRFQGEGSQDGSVPNSGLIIDATGNLYGVTAYGGTGDCFLLGVKAGCGTVYEISPPQQKGGAWTKTILYSFPTSKQGYFPNGDLVFDSAGNLYGATAFGGTKGTTCDSFYGGQCGVVFELSPPKQKGGKWTETVLHNFANGVDGASPNGGLVLDRKGDVYGTTFAGGGKCSGGGCGIAFALHPPTTNGRKWSEKVLYRFVAEEGATPKAGFVFGVNGHLYGTLFGGGSNGDGVVFDLVSLDGGRGPWKETVFHRFSGGNDGAGPASGVTFDLHGNLLGTTATATNRSAQGDVFRMEAPTQRGGSWIFQVLYTFTGNPDGAQPSATVVLDRSGNVYGTTIDGGAGTGCGFGHCGTVFEISP